MLSLPPEGELMNMCASMLPAVPFGGKYGAPLSTSPVALIQLSLNAA